MQRGSVFLALILTVTGAYAQVNLTGCGTAKIDGVISAGEWSGAGSQNLVVNTEAGPVTATLYMMNDNLNLYMALRFPQSSPLYGSLGFEFDNNNNGVMFEQGDDSIVANNQIGYIDGFRTYLPPCTNPLSCGLEDVSDGGTTDGQMAFHNDGTNSVYEISHPLVTPDYNHDFYLPPGATIGFSAFLRIVDGNGSALYDTTIPATGLGKFTAGTCLPPILSGCGTAVIDGVVNPLEWKGAAQFTFAVRTPRGGSEPATLYVMNDSFNLYTALVFDQSSLITAGTAGNFSIFSFDSDSSGFGSLHDDSISADAFGTFNDMAADVCAGGVGLCAQYDTTLGGTTDGSAAFSNNGSITTYEYAHPLHDGDAYDISVPFGGAIPYSLGLSMVNAPGVYPIDYAFTSFPAGPGYEAGIGICRPASDSAVSDLSREVSTLSQQGILDAKSGDMLSKDLSKANDDLLKGKTRQAIKDLNAFTSDVAKIMRRGDLAPRYGQPLIDAANSAIQQLGG